MVKIPRSVKSFLKARVLTPLQWAFLSPLRRRQNRAKPYRCLEISPGGCRLPGFETLNVIGGRGVDYIGDASKRLPFPDETFDLIYASHILEHVPWYKTEATLHEWTRVLKHGGRLEIWTPDGLKIARAFVAAEDGNSHDFHLDGWWRFNEMRDPSVWMSGRCFSYGDGTGKPNDPNWHRALFSERRLRNLMRDAGLTEIRRLAKGDVRGHDHGWINLGCSGIRP
jgi:SAM-dependent methyltransferase